MLPVAKCPFSLWFTKSKITRQDEGSELLEEDLTKEELLNALKGFQPDKTPADDGFTKEFYETFLELLWSNLDSFNETFQTGKLSISQRRRIKYWLELLQNE